MVRAILCGHDFNPEDFPGYPDDYAGYCPACVARMKDDDAEKLDADDEPDATGIKEFDGESFAEDDEEGNDETDLDDYEEEESEDNQDPLAEPTEEEEEKEMDELVKETANNLQSVYSEKQEQQPGWLQNNLSRPPHVERVQTPAIVDPFSL